jgi:hypothetical protein
MRDARIAETAAQVGTFHVSRDPHPASPAVKAAVAQASKRAERETAAIKAKRGPSRLHSRQLTHAAKLRA